MLQNVLMVLLIAQISNQFSMVFYHWIVIIAAEVGHFTNAETPAFRILPKSMTNVQQLGPH